MKQFARLALCAIIAIVALNIQADVEDVEEVVRKAVAFKLEGTISKSEIADDETGDIILTTYSIRLVSGESVDIPETALAKNKVDLSSLQGKKAVLDCIGYKWDEDGETLYEIETVKSAVLGTKKVEDDDDDF